MCCIPFALHDVALGGIVATAPKGDRKYVVKVVVKPSAVADFLAGSEKAGRLIYETSRS
ncbi:MAG: hypothetical protein M3Y33_05130 [Actinomycetota bacterium]|nr:hypothetical protein [Actinomycetota bacterium]